MPDNAAAPKLSALMMQLISAKVFKKLQGKSEVTGLILVYQRLLKVVSTFGYF